MPELFQRVNNYKTWYQNYVIPMMSYWNVFGINIFHQEHLCSPIICSLSLGLSMRLMFNIMCSFWIIVILEILLCFYVFPSAAVNLRYYQHHTEWGYLVSKAFNLKSDDENLVFSFTICITSHFGFSKHQFASNPDAWVTFNSRGMIYSFVRWILSMLLQGHLTYGIFSQTTSNTQYSPYICFQKDSEIPEWRRICRI